MMAICRVWLGMVLVVLAVASCRYTPLPDLAGDAVGDDAPSQLELELLAGDIGGPGNLDGVGTAARFDQPFGVAVDSAGNIYVADRSNHAIRRISAAGAVTTLAGTAGIVGDVDGVGAAARFNEPIGVAVDSVGNIYVADTGNHTIRKITDAGIVTTLAGAARMSGSTDGSGTVARFNGPTGVAVDSAGNIYVTDYDNQTIRKISAAGTVTTLAGTAGVAGSTDGTGTAARFSHPSGVTIDRVGNAYIADYENHTIRKIDTARVVTTVAGTAGMLGSTDGTGVAARFRNPSGVAVDITGNVFVADQGNSTIRKVTPAGVVTTLAGTAGMLGSTDGTGVVARFSHASCVVSDNAGNVYVGDSGNNLIRRATIAGDVTTLAGAAGASGSTDDTGAAARFLGPSSVAFDNVGNVYVADTNNHTIRKVAATGVVTTLAGTAGMSGYKNDVGAEARFYFPSGVATDSVGDVYVADLGNSAIRKVSAAGVVTTLATVGFGPVGVAVDRSGNVYVTSMYTQIISKISAVGAVTTLAGTEGESGSTDGMGAAARFNHPVGVVVDSTGNIYIADSGNFTIRKLTTAGVVSTLAGTAGTSGRTDGMGAAARFAHPRGLAVDGVGNVYVADSGTRTIRKLTAAGAVTTIAGGIGTVGVRLGTMPSFTAPQSLAIIRDSIVIGDSNAILLLRHGAQ